MPNEAASLQIAELTLELKREAGRKGFELAGVCPAVEATGNRQLMDWLASGYHGEMHYVANRAHAYAHPRHVLEGVRSLLVLGLNYRTSEPATPSPGQGRVSRYAWGADYHEVIRPRLRELSDFVQLRAPGAMVRGVVDTAPLLEREFAALAGVGWVGKNTLLLNKRLGSWFFLAVLLTDLELEYDAPVADHCGVCRACLDACPTQAFTSPYVLDARRCISYLNIELRGQIPAELRGGMGDWLFGCDVCQDVCPWNRKAPGTSEPAFQPAEAANPVDLCGLFDLDEREFRDRFRHTPLWRPKRRGLLRTAAIVLGNQRCESAVPALAKGLFDEESLVRGACAWALGQIASAAACDLLQRRLLVENDAETAAEMTVALLAAGRMRRGE